MIFCQRLWQAIRMRQRGRRLADGGDKIDIYEWTTGKRKKCIFPTTV